jgi:hypothetical protein
VGLPPPGAVSCGGMRRELFFIAAGVSAVLFVGICVLWADSYEHANIVGYAKDEGIAVPANRPGSRPQPLLSVHVALCGRGEIRLNSQSRQARATFKSWVEVGWFYERLPIGGWTNDPHPGFFGRLGIEYQNAYGRRILFLPCWAVAVATALLPFVLIVRIVRQRRARGQGRCPNCGYDLRATPDRCPECGTVPAPTPSSS